MWSYKVFNIHIFLAFPSHWVSVSIFVTLTIFFQLTNEYFTLHFYIYAHFSPIYFVIRSCMYEHWLGRLPNVSKNCKKIIATSEHKSEKHTTHRLPMSSSKISGITQDPAQSFTRILHFPSLEAQTSLSRVTLVKEPSPILTWLPRTHQSSESDKSSAPFTVGAG